MIAGAALYLLLYAYQVQGEIRIIELGRYETFEACGEAWDRVPRPYEYKVNHWTCERVR